MCSCFPFLRFLAPRRETSIPYETPPQSPLMLSDVVETKSGPIRGKRFQFDDGIAEAFLGIPFAEPPVGERRFQKPVPAAKWTETRECVKFAAACPQPENPRLPIQSEDCLYLNVFAPKLESKTPLTVLFYIHGGGFLTDCSSLVGDEGICRYLCVHHQLVVVTVDYRLGAFGFFTLDNEKARGNYGLWDVTLALNWVHENIGLFGGDVENITVCGQSAGGCMTDLLTLSPHSRGYSDMIAKFLDLFKRAMTFSGTSQNGWLWMNAALVRKVAIEYAKFLGFDGDAKDDDQILNYYRQIDAQRLALGFSPVKEFKFWNGMRLPFAPVADGDFFPKSLDELRAEAPPKEFINGITEYEGLLFTLKLKTVEEMRQQTAMDVRTVRPDFTRDYSLALVDELVNEEHLEDLAKYSHDCVEIISNSMFNHGTWRLSSSRAALNQRIYQYRLTYYESGSLGLFSKFIPFEAATHCMDLPYLFGQSICTNFRPSDKDKNFMHRYITMLTNFAKTGNPNSEEFAEKWEPVDSNAETYFLFARDDYGMREGFCDGGGRIWKKILDDQPIDFAEIEKRLDDGTLWD